MKTLSYEDLLNVPPYSLPQKEKGPFLTQQLLALTQYHLKHCPSYKNILQGIQFKASRVEKIDQIPFIPVRLFKDLELSSAAPEDIVKIMTSSGTTGQKVSKIYLDKETSINQQKTLIKIVSDSIGKDRLPMLIVDSPSVLQNRKMMSARGAGILGFMLFASDKHYVLNDEMNVDVKGVHAFLKKHRDKPILIFGFTFMIWRYLKEMQIPIPNGILIHGGGWKKLKEEAVSPSIFKQTLKKNLGLSKVYDYYGMVEQTGSVYMECEKGYFHASIFSDVILRRESDFSVCNTQEKGIIQVLSMLPKSYPGHSILTEDVGILLGEDNCACGRLGKYFIVQGRLKNAEIRGCSDTFERS